MCSKWLFLKYYENPDINRFFLRLGWTMVSRNDKRCELFKTMNSKQNFPFLYAFFFYIFYCWVLVYFCSSFLKLVCSGSVKKTLYEVGLIYNLQPKLKTFWRLLCPLIDWGNYMTIEEMLSVELPGTYPINPFAGLQNTWPNQYKLSMLLP